MAKKKANNEIDSLKRYIRGILQERDKYSKEMSYQIELLASDLLVFVGFAMRLLRKKLL